MRFQVMARYKTTRSAAAREATNLVVVNQSPSPSQRSTVNHREEVSLHPYLIKILQIARFIQAPQVSLSIPTPDSQPGALHSFQLL